MTNTVTIEGEFPINLKLPPMKPGQDYAFTIEITDDNDAVQDTTGWDMEIKGRENNANGAEIFDLTVGTEITHTAALGKFAVKIPDTTTTNIDVSRIAWDCKVTDGNGDISFPFEGIIEVKEAVTR